MTDPDQNGNKTVFRPSPLQALKHPGQLPAPSTPPVAPPPPLESAATPVRKARPAARPAARRTGGRTALIVLFVVVTLLAIGYVAVQLTTGAAPTFRLGAATMPGTAT